MRPLGQDGLSSKMNSRLAKISRSRMVALARFLEYDVLAIARNQGDAFYLKSCQLAMIGQVAVDQLPLMATFEIRIREVGTTVRRHAARYRIIIGIALELIGVLVGNQLPAPDQAVHTRRVQPASIRCERQRGILGHRAP